MSSGEESQLKAGHPPAVKAGGMRITQHKDGHNHKSNKDPVIGDVTGLSGPSNIPTNPTLVSGAPAKSANEFVLEAAQVAHTPKPPAIHAQRPQGNIHQPRK